MINLLHCFGKTIDFSGEEINLVKIFLAADITVSKQIKLSIEVFVFLDKSLINFIRFLDSILIGNLDLVDLILSIGLSIFSSLGSLDSFLIFFVQKRSKSLIFTL